MSSTLRPAVTGHDESGPFSDQSGERTLRAAEEAMVVVQEAPDLYTVYSGETGRYTVDLREGAGSCDDEFYRHPAGGCKHRRRVEMTIGKRHIPFDETDVDTTLVCQFSRYVDRGAKALGYGRGDV